MIMLGANAVRKRREKERKEKAARGIETQVFPFIKPFGARFDRNELPYFKYRKTLILAQQTRRHNKVSFHLALYRLGAD